MLAMRRADEEVLMSSYILVVYTSPVDGREDEYNAWYDDVHLGEFASLPGVVSGRRYQVHGDGKPVYAAIYELTSPPDEVFSAMNKAVRDGTLHMSDALDPASAKIETLIPR
jgi:hypothetical protein